MSLQKGSGHTVCSSSSIEEHKPAPCALMALFSSRNLPKLFRRGSISFIFSFTTSLYCLFSADNGFSSEIILERSDCKEFESCKMEYMSLWGCLLQLKSRSRQSHMHIFKVTGHEIACRCTVMQHQRRPYVKVIPSWLLVPQ